MSEPQTPCATASPMSGLVMNVLDTGTQTTARFGHCQAVEWFHGGQLPEGITESEDHFFTFFHVGSREAALDRIGPDQQAGSSAEGWYRAASLYRIEILPGATVCPHAHRDEWGDEENADGMNVGSEWFTGEACGGVGAHGQPGYDVHPYRNGYEAPGSRALAVRPSMARVVEDLGPHPAWASTPADAASV